MRKHDESGIFKFRTLGLAVGCLAISFFLVSIAFATFTDTDGDGFSNSLEKTRGSDPYDDLSVPPFGPVAAGGKSHSLAILPDGRVLSWGSDSGGELGDGEAGGSRSYMDFVLGPEGQAPLNGVASIAAGQQHSTALLEDGGVLCWGKNGDGQLGSDTSGSVSLPVPVIDAATGLALADVLAVRAGDSHTLALTTEGGVKAWGSNSSGQLGDSTTDMKSAAVSVLNTDGTAPLTGVLAIAAGSNHSLVLMHDGTLLAFGANDCGQLGDGTVSGAVLPQPVLSPDGTDVLDNVVAVAAGQYLSLAVQADGTLWFWGEGKYGQSDDDSKSIQKLPAQVAGPEGDGFMTGVESVSCTKHHVLVSDGDGNCFSFGKNEKGQLGIGSTESSHVPLAVLSSDGTAAMADVLAVGTGHAHSFALQPGFRLYAFGDGEYGMLGTGETAKSRIPTLIDSDGDQLADFWEMAWFGTLSTDPDADPDNDGLTNLVEYQDRTDPTIDQNDPEGDNDGDGMTNGWELLYGLDPYNPTDADVDSDGDGMDNLTEFETGTDPSRTDTDFDGLPDTWEISMGFDPALFTQSDLLGMWDFNETEGNTAFDASPLLTHALLSETLRDTDHAGAFVVFDGVSSAAEAPASPERTAGAYTVSVRFRIDDLYGNAAVAPSADGEMTILELTGPDGGASLRLYKTAGHALAVTVGADAPALQTADGALLEDKWYHAVAAVDAENIVTTLYIDLVEADTASAGIALDGESVSFGSGGPAAAPLAGALDSVCIINRALSPDEAAELGRTYTDEDGDGLTLLAEYDAGTDLDNADTDGDGLTDADELYFGSDPLLADTDGDGLADAEEMNAGTDPRSADTDFDGLADGWEVDYGFDPLDAPDGLLAWWAFDETGGSQVLDLAGGSHHAALTGTLSTRAVLKNARSFDGTDDFAATATAPEFSGNVFSWLAQVRFDALYGNTATGTAPDGAMNVVALIANDGTPLCTLSRTPEHSLAAELVDPASGVTVRLESSHGTVLPGNWYRIALVFDDSEVSLLVNGRAADTAACNETLQWTSESVRFASSGTGDDAFMTGSLDDVRFYSVALTAADLETLAATTADSDDDSLSLYDESRFGTDPESSDTDGDGLTDSEEILAAQPTDPLNADSDGDLMSDGWELEHGFDPNSDADMLLDADSDRMLNFEEFIVGTDPHAADTDGDGISDYDEAFIHHTDPLLADTDGDGQSDAWELDNGTDPLTPDGAADLDGDGLTNEEEALLGTDPLLADTDGDGVSDYEEVILALTDPLAADFDGTATTVQALDGIDRTAMLGTWEADGTAVVSRDRKGWLEYEIDLPEAGIYRLTVEGTQDNPQTVKRHFTLDVFTDGVYTSRDVLDAPYGTVGRARFYLPYLEAGQHTVRIQWRNNELYTFLKVTGLKVEALGGNDADQNDVPDWQQNRTENIASLDADTPETSAVSPVCIEGAGQFIESMKVLSSFIPEDSILPVEDGQAVNIIKRSPFERWYADIELDPAAATEIDLSWQDGDKTTAHSVTWTVTNVMTAEDATIRVDDALLLNGFPEDVADGDVLIEVDGEQYLTVPGAPVPHRFEQAGSYTVSAVYTPDTGDPVVGEMTVDVKSCIFNGTTVAGILNKTWLWDNPGIPHEAVLEYDPQLTVIESPLNPQGRLLEVTATQDKHARIIARLGEDGPVMASAEFKAIAYEGGSRSLNYDVIETYADGSTLGEMRLSLGYVPDDLRIEIDIFVSGVTFEDGTTKRVITAEDFDELGEYRYRMIKSAEVTTSICHHLKVYYNDVHIGGM